ncbi:G-type lectin S-receptor-like serine/threonine-protein kinase At4g03230 isoform X4 [Phaseolus vulgaris]|uniref:G-type lectin S-receptor-like serine/threonine-protein kinase At4g03230 isoform X4 n=1 Tax=Phaseolus vulgaris TaxID=3885 RepID=UPI0035C97503
MKREGVVLSFYLLLLWLLLCFQICLGGDTLKATQKITDQRNLVSSNATFELGFFSPPGVKSGEKRYLGIWYHKLEPQTVVWVANRDDPVADSSGVFRIAEDGNVVVEYASKSLWSSKLEPSSSTNRTLKLLDSGNLVLIDDSETTYPWESFKNPTDTFLPGMKMEATLSLTCWRNSADPTPGSFTFKLTQQEGKQSFRVQKETQIYWALDEPDTEAASQMVFNLLNNDISSNKSYSYSNKTLFVSQPSMYNKSRLLMNSSGEIVFLQWDEKEFQWNKKWWMPKDKCDTHNYCGNFGICNRENYFPRCKCLPGFISNVESNSEGCRRKSISCTNKDVTFLNLTNIKLGNPDQRNYTETEAECQSTCINMCSETQCQAYSFNNSIYGDRGSSSCNIWTRNLPSLLENFPRGRDLSILVNTADIEEPSGNHSTLLELILLVTLCSLATVACITGFGIVWKKKKARKLDGASTRIQESLHESERHVKGLIGLGSLEEKDIKGVEVPCYTFASILAATDNFSDSNKLGRGGYGPVYKGTFPGGQEIAVKRLSSVSTQGLQEFKNEVILIAKLQHRNLVRLRGYCIKGVEKILLYEYMSNKSLDSFIFDRSRTILLDWPMRFEIIVGIARGMLYLHQDSRLRVIHRDLKTSNVLLDEEMNPKISDFGLAKIFGGKETEASTERVMGTFGYMAPEYALDGFFSVKSDVFSFGVVLLEILSGKKNTGFFESKQISSLLGYAWNLWSGNKLLDLMDSCLGETCNQNQFIKCAIIGLLCTQDEPIDRPTMSNILYMLDKETTTMPIPRQPTFFMTKRYSSSASSSTNPEISLHLDTSYQEGR